jgi:uncharacterized membrane protein
MAVKGNDGGMGLLLQGMTVHVGGSASTMQIITLWAGAWQSKTFTAPATDMPRGECRMAEQTETAETTAGTERLVFFSDGVIAIAITLLVLDIRLPELPEHADSAALAAALVSIVPKIAAYALSFLVVGEFWFVHHTRFTYINRCDARLIWLNMLFLMTIGFVPFASSVMSEHPNAVAYALYDGTMAIAALLSAALWGYAITGDRLVPPGLTAEIRRRSLVAPLRVAAVFVLSGVLAQANVHAGRWAFLLLIPAAVEWHGRQRGRHHP